MAVRTIAKPRLLVVDDETDINLTFKTGLEVKGFIVDAFSDPILALSNFKPGVYDLLLLDVRMPQINGFELYEKIRKIDSNVKAYFITAQDVYYQSLMEIFPDREEMLLSGAKGVLRKHISIDDLIETVQRLRRDGDQ
jgi:two-component system catabolic regulation response regulator CreB/two-component system response regulator ChvI